MEPLYTKALGLDEWQIGLIYAGFTFPIFFVSIFVGRYIDRHEARWITAVGMFLHAFSAFGFALILDPLFLFVFALVSGVGDALILPAVFTMFDRLSSYRTKEHISGVKMFGESFGYFAGPLLGGALAFVAGYASAFFALGVFLVLLAIAVIAVPLRVACPAVRRHG